MFRIPCSAINRKTGNTYQVTGTAIDATNATNGRVMVVYTREGSLYVRELEEFMIKFQVLQ